MTQLGKQIGKRLDFLTGDDVTGIQIRDRASTDSSIYSIVEPPHSDLTSPALAIEHGRDELERLSRLGFPGLTLF